VADTDEVRDEGALPCVLITAMAEDDPPNLSLDVVSGCYKVPDGKEVDRF
jgi:hypothetical protein